MKIGILRFPGSNCDYDVGQLCQSKEIPFEYIWHETTQSLSEFSALILPGGFSFGDYLRAGALAAHSPAMTSVKEFAERGGPVLGICNGFQILCEAGLLPGTLLKNESLRFQEEWVDLKLVNPHSFFAKDKSTGEVFRLPIAHGQGRYYAPEAKLEEIAQHQQIWFTYQGRNPNGSWRDIAGIKNKKGNVCALMPHPERALFAWMGGTDGWSFL